MRFLFATHFVFMMALVAFAVSAQIDQRISDVIAGNVLGFGHSVGLGLGSQTNNNADSIIFSPLSLMTALSLLTLGAKGKSYQELSELLGLNSDSELIQNPNKFHEQFGLMLNDLQHKNLNRDNNNGRPNAIWHSKKSRGLGEIRMRNRPPVEHIIKVANGLFVQNGYSLNLDYSQVLKTIYETEFTQLDFVNRNDAARDYINAWVSKATFGKIPHVVTSKIHESTKVVLASTLYFKAFWETQFFDKGTHEGDFFPDGQFSPPIKVQMMGSIGTFPFYDAKEYDCRIIGLPYRANETTMYVIQPNHSSRQRLRNLQQILDAHKINSMIDNMEQKQTTLILPKMHFKSSMKMKTILQHMNVHDIFLNGYSDLSLIGERGGNVVENRSPYNADRDISFQSIYRKKPSYGSLQIPSSSLEDIASLALSNLESSRQKTTSIKSDLFVDDILHDVDFSVDEQGTEAAAATIGLLLKSGSEVLFQANTPFLIIIRHDPTKLPLFYGTINRPRL